MRSRPALALICAALLLAGCGPTPPDPTAESRRQAANGQVAGQVIDAMHSFVDACNRRDLNKALSLLATYDTTPYLAHTTMESMDVGWNGPKEIRDMLERSFSMPPIPITQLGDENVDVSPDGALAIYTANYTYPGKQPRTFAEANLITVFRKDRYGRMRLTTVITPHPFIQP